MAAATAQVFTVGGTVQAGQGVYLPRAVDDELLALCRAGTFAYILAPRQSGKSSLMIHTAERLAAEGVRTATIDLTRIGTQVDAEQWYFGVLYEIRRQLRLKTPLAPWWQGHADLGLTQRLTLFFEEVVLGEISGSVVIFVDEIDTTLSLSFTDDFYAAIRAMYVARAEKPDFIRLSFVLIGVATPGDLIRDPKRTPFNIGHRVEMPDFTAAEARPLADGLGLPEAEATRVLGWVLDWTGGHPYLTQRLCQALTERKAGAWSARDVDRVVRATFLGERSEQDNNLQFVRDMLTKRAPDQVAVLTTYRAVLQGRAVPDDEQSLVHAHLKLSGAVRVAQHRLQIRNRLYRTIFDTPWVKEHLPATALRAALTNPLVRFGLLAGLIYALSVTVLGAWALDRAQVAEAQRQQAETLGRRNRTLVARTLAEDAVAQLVIDPERSLLLAMEAVSVTLELNEPIVSQAEDALRQALAYPRLRTTLRGHRDAVRSAAFSPDGRTLVTTSWDGTALLWDVGSGQARATLRDPVLSATFSPDGGTLVTASDDYTAKLWDAATGQERAALLGHTDRVHSAAFSPDGHTIVTTSADGTAKLWDAASGQERATLRGHTGVVWRAAFSPDGSTVLTAGQDSTARQYLAQINDLMALAQSRVSRTLTPEERATYLGEPLPTATPRSPITPTNAP